MSNAMALAEVLTIDDGTWSARYAPAARANPPSVDFIVYALANSRNLGEKGYVVDRLVAGASRTLADARAILVALSELAPEMDHVQVLWHRQGDESGARLMADPSTPENVDALLGYVADLPVEVFSGTDRFTVLAS